MIKVYASSVIDAPADSVWARIRDFNGLPAWTPFVAESRIEGIKILHVDGLGGGGGSGNRADSGDAGGGLADSVVNSALRFRTQAPLIDQLLREIGIQGGDVGRVAQGLLDRTQGSSGPPVPANPPGE